MAGPGYALGLRCEVKRALVQPGVAKHFPADAGAEKRFETPGCTSARFTSQRNPRAYPGPGVRCEVKSALVQPGVAKHFPADAGAETSFETPGCTSARFTSQRNPRAYPGPGLRCEVKRALVQPGVAKHFPADAGAEKSFATPGCT